MHGIFNGTFKNSIFNKLIKSISYCLDVIDAAPNTKVSPKTSVNAGFFMPEAVYCLNLQIEMQVSASA